MVPLQQYCVLLWFNVIVRIQSTFNSLATCLSAWHDGDSYTLRVSGSKAHRAG